MITTNIRIDGTGRARIIVKDKRGNVYASEVEGALTELPFYILDGKRHDLTEREREMLRERIRGYGE